MQRTIFSFLAQFLHPALQFHDFLVVRRAPLVHFDIGIGHELRESFV
jgi:hypothetical protein